MKPTEFEYQTNILSRPKGMTENECGSLAIHTDGHTCISLWRMTWRERVSALIFGRVWLSIHSGVTQPPVALDEEHRRTA